jgi:pimeloyl-ACP methyl ester carboxylesterase
MTPHQETGFIPSGDVSLFFRRFGHQAGTPVLILHGGSYYDSADWVPVARHLAEDREVVAIDFRGFGESSWSPDKDYSDAAHLADITTVLDHFDWRRAALLGHSRGGLYAIMFAARYPDRTAGLLIAEHCPGGGPPRPRHRVVHARPTVYPTIDDLEASLSRDKNTPPGSEARARLESLARKVEGGFILGPRDPDFLNRVPSDADSSVARYEPDDAWRDIAAVRAPIRVLRATRSTTFLPHALVRLRRTVPQGDIVDIVAEHDIAASAPSALTAIVQDFLVERVDRPAPELRADQHAPARFTP